MAYLNGEWKGVNGVIEKLVNRALAQPRVSSEPALVCVASEQGCISHREIPRFAQND